MAKFRGCDVIKRRSEELACKGGLCQDLWASLRKGRSGEGQGSMTTGIH